MEFLINNRDAIFSAMVLLILLLTLYVGSEKGKAKKENDVHNASLYETLERVLVGLIIVFYLEMLFLGHQDIMATGFGEIISRLEALKNG